jgi:hypothetical protein
MQTSTSTAKIPAIRITITRAEGPRELCRKPHAFEGPRCWVAARAWLMGQSETFPASGGYDKHDFVVEFADGETVYKGRLDCKASDQDNADLDVAAHVRGELEYWAARGDVDSAAAIGRFAIP